MSLRVRLGHRILVLLAISLVPALASAAELSSETDITVEDLVKEGITKEDLATNNKLFILPSQIFVPRIGVLWMNAKKNRGVDDDD